MLKKDEITNEDMMSEWQAGKVVWVENHNDASYEIIYELDQDLDNLKQVNVMASSIYKDIKKGDRIRILMNPSPLIVREQ